MKTAITIFLSFLLCYNDASGQELGVMFYNVENLFDTENDTLKADDEFLPVGERRWTPSRYHRKLASIARAVAAAGEWELPSLVGLCEVENEEVLKDLVYGTVLSAGNYGIVHRDSPDARGIDVALLYRRDHFSVAGVESWLPESHDGEAVQTRNVLYVKVTRRSDTLHLVLCHLPSRRGGILAAEGLRGRMISLAGSKVDSVMTASGGRAALIVMGDFNAPPDEPLMSEFCGETGLINLSADCASRGKGSYKYQGTWEMIDQVLVSSSMVDTASVFSVLPGSFGVVDAPFLLAEDVTYPGHKPFPTYGGYRYSGGYSDHLPVVIKMTYR
ncbi:MAG TPA: endonuclease [Bacteroidales bacterium]|nr:endonuclease [Bacteroidales bacterium]